MDNLKKLIIYIISKLRQTGRTELIKTVYLFEYYHSLAFGHQFSEARFVRYKYGPYCAEVINAIKQMDGIITENFYIGMYGPAYSYRLVNQPEKEIYAMPLDKMALADLAIKVVSSMNYNEMLNYVYSTPPMTKVIMAEQVSGYLHYEEELDMTTRKQTPKFTRNELRMAKERNRNRKKRGTDQEYISHLLVVYRELEPLKRRANICLTKMK
ncbi:type II toxin-antitoxin system antitoxin SocA domain-containing protein [Desulfoscipio geothermicus]|uniref:Antitoxin SocA-like Panacea domain-containing protein n=1 Tax=Desulfoscipio geothermicus DSM 3669 TaxID=1121426 RepID=A0A1I6ELT1_9FIRM|nr:type II toxin-antitoxin system antitoxin SocA domain-containing protein [Desulfoscipio geothermicus]SFR18655.1 Protein of unknown function [Desulfoscipio geothermicus DSM 3669]